MEPLQLTERNTIIRNLKLWLIYEYDVCMGEQWACSEDQALRLFMTKRGYTADHGLFATLSIHS